MSAGPGGDRSGLRSGPSMSLTLRVLRSTSGLAAADLLALDLAGIAGDETGVAKRLAQGLIVLDERPGDAVTDRAGLASDSAAIDLDGDVEARGELHRLERLPHDHAPRFTTEERVERPFVNGDLAVAGLEVDAGGCRLAAASAVVILRGSGHEVISY